MSGPDAAELLDLARALCAAPPGALEGRWPRAVALLTRQSLEVTLDDFWAERAPGVGESRAWRPKLLCLDAYLDDHDLGRDLYQTWATLSRACHVHAYEIDPTIDELRRWMDDVAGLRERLEAAA